MGHARTHGPLDEVDLGAAPPSDLHGMLAAAREAAPAVRVRFFGEPAWLIGRYDDVAAAFADEDAMPAAAAYSLFAEPVQGRTLQCMTGDEHRVGRTLVSPAFRPSQIRTLALSLLRPAADELAAELASRPAQFAARSGGTDLVAGFAARLPFLVITRMLGLDGAALPELRRWATALFSFVTDPSTATAGAAQFTGFLTDLIAERRNGAHRDDLLSRLATAEFTGDNGVRHRLPDEQIFSFIRLLFPAGADTTYRAIGSLLYALLAHPGEWERVRDDSDARTAAVEEALRWEPPVAVQPRRTAKPCSWDGIAVGAGEWVLYGTAAANRDPARFDDPDHFDPDRFAPRRSEPAAPVLTFGGGPHFCLGAHLARAEMRAALDALTARFPRAVLAVPPGEVEVGDAILRGPKALPVHLDGAG